MRRISILILLVALSGLLLVPPEVPAKQSLVNPGKAVIDTTVWNTFSLDPAQNYDYVLAGQINQEVYESLVTFPNNTANAIEPWLAINYTITSDGLQYTFYTRPNVNFALQPGESTAQPFNAYVMQYSLDRAIIMNDYNGPVKTLDQFVSGGAQAIYSSNANSISLSQSFLASKAIWAHSANVLTINVTAPYEGFLSILATQLCSAVSPKAVIDHEPTSYNTNQLNGTYGMVSLSDMFPGVASSTIVSNLGLPSNYNSSNSGIVPQSGFYDPAAYTWLSNHSAGTGSYYLQSYNQNVSASLLKNTNWWNSANFNPYSVNEIDVIKVLDLNTEISDLTTGNADMVINIPRVNVSQFIDSAKMVSTISGVNYYHFPSFSNYIMGFNLNDSLPAGTISENPLTSNYSYGTLNYANLVKYEFVNSTGQYVYASPQNPFTSLAFRGAFEYAFDYNTYIQQIFDGLGIRMEGVIPQGMEGHDSQLISSTDLPIYIPNTAQQLFKAVGWQGNITLYYANNSLTQMNAFKILKHSIESLNVGINITIKSISFQSYFGNITVGNLAMYQSGWAADYANPDNFVEPYVQTGGVYAKADSYSHPTNDALMTQALHEQNRATRISDYNQIEANASLDNPFIYLCQPYTNILMKNWISGVNDPATDSMNPGLLGVNYQYLGKNAITTTSSSANSKIYSSGSSMSTVSSLSSVTSSNTPNTISNTPSTSSNTLNTSTNTTTTKASGNSTTTSSQSSGTTINLGTTPGFDSSIFVFTIGLLMIPVLRKRRANKK